MKFTINHHNLTSITNCFSVAAERFREDAKVFRQVVAAGGNSFMTADAAKTMAEQFDRQAEEASGYFQVFSAVENDLTIHYDHDAEDDENPFHPESPEGREWQREFDRMVKSPA